ncbi:MAG: hypothetical protein PF444_07470, partial [Bacteroidales bacterium]|nr:hypothetical protein [Bacteroidales bacterium]
GHLLSIGYSWYYLHGYSNPKLNTLLLFFPQKLVAQIHQHYCSNGVACPEFDFRKIPAATIYINRERYYSDAQGKHLQISNSQK